MKLTDNVVIVTDLNWSIDENKLSGYTDPWEIWFTVLLIID